MGINRAQYIQGNDSSTVLAGTVQGVTAGFGVSISNTGALSVVPSVLPKPRIINLKNLEPIDGTNDTFTLIDYTSGTPVTLSSSDNLAVFLGGVPQLPGISYTTSATQVTFSSPPPPGCTFLAITVSAV